MAGRVNLTTHVPIYMSRVGAEGREDVGRVGRGWREGIISERDSKSTCLISMLWYILRIYNYINTLALVHPKQFTVYIWTWKEGTKASFLHNPLGLLFGMESTHISAKLLDVYSRILQFSLRIQETKTVGFHRKVTKSTGILCTNSLVRIINAACAL